MLKKDRVSSLVGETLSFLNEQDKQQDQLPVQSVFHTHTQHKKNKLEKTQMKHLFLFLFTRKICFEQSPLHHLDLKVLVASLERRQSNCSSDYLPVSPHYIYALPSMQQAAVAAKRALNLLTTNIARVFSFCQVTINKLFLPSLDKAWLFRSPVANDEGSSTSPSASPSISSKFSPSDVWNCLTISRGSQEGKGDSNSAMAASAIKLCVALAKPPIPIAFPTGVECLDQALLSLLLIVRTLLSSVG